MRKFTMSLLFVLLTATAGTALGQTTSFTYQGQLKSGGTGVTGSYDIQFRLFDALSGGTQQGPTLLFDGNGSNPQPVTVTGGLFTIALDFGSQFNGQTRYLDIALRIHGNGFYTFLTPRQTVSPAPYSIFSDSSAFSSAPWLSSGGNIYYPTGSVGIGTSTPSNRLTVFNPGGGDSSIAIDSGISAAQNSFLRLNDRGTGIWSLNKLTNNDLSIREVGPSTDRIYFAQGGFIGINNSSPQVPLHIQGGSDASLSGGGHLVLGQTTGTNVVLDNNEIMCRNNGAVAHFFINNSGGDVTIAPLYTTHVGVLEIMGGSDLSENFDVNGELRPGMVVVIDPDHPGQLKLSTQAYDSKVAGIISGANGIQTGMRMGQKGTPADGKQAVALTGRVYCYVDATSTAVEPGDLLTTSNTAGHAMRVDDHARATGAILGKAMTSLKRGERGLVLVLVSLQ